MVTAANLHYQTAVRQLCLTVAALVYYNGAWQKHQIW